MNQHKSMYNPLPADGSPRLGDDQKAALTRLETEIEALSGRVSTLSERTEQLPGEIHRLSAFVRRAVAWLAVPLWIILVVLAAIAV